MVTPYYADDLVVLYHGDCTNVVEWLVADVLVTDPPYGVAYVSNRSKYGSSDPIANDNDTGLRDVVLRQWNDHPPTGLRPALVFGTWRAPRVENVSQLIVWDKGNVPGMGDLSLPWGPAHEEIYVIGSGFKGKRRPNVYRVPTLPPSDGRRPDHPTPKPNMLMELLIEYCPPEWVIADPFAGSGATLIAARNLGRRAIGVEIEERYCELIANRLSQDVLPLNEAAEPTRGE